MQLRRLLPLALCAAPLCAQSTFDLEKLTSARLGSSLDLDISGAPPFALMLVVPSNNAGPTPLAALDPSDSRVLSVGTDLLSAATVKFADLFGDIDEDDEDAEDTHLQLDDGLVDVASLYGSWDQYVVSEDNWRVRWPEARGLTQKLGGFSLYSARYMLSTPWRGIRHIEATGRQLYVDEGACVRFEYEASGGLLLGVEILSSRWLFPVEAPTLRVYESSPATVARPGSTFVRCTRAAVDSDSFEAEDDATLEETGEWTTVYTVTHTLATPLPLARSTRVVVEVDCRRHSCNAAVHNVFFRVAV